MSRGPALSLWTRFLAAFAATVILGVGAVAITGLLGLNSQTPQVRPTVSPARGYVLQWRAAGTPDRSVTVAADGSGCEVLEKSDFLYRACVLTTNLDPAVIAGEAFGRINVESTPAREALIWRAVLNGDETFCLRGGLAGPPLSECENAVRAGFRVATDSSLRAEAASERGDPRHRPGRGTRGGLGPERP